MGRYCHKYKKSFIAIIILLEIIIIPNLVNGQNGIAELEIKSSFDFIELAEDKGQKINKTELNFNLPHSDWNLTQLQLNFTSIKLASEIITFEEEQNATGFEKIRKDRDEIYGMQLNITEPTTIFGVEIFGYKLESSSSPGPVYVRIEGWNSGNRRPNDAIYGQQIELNFSSDPRWNIHTFLSPIDLAVGYYCLVIDGSNANSEDRYYWYINNQNIDSQLYMCYKDDEGDWYNRQGDVFLHKIKQRVDRSYFPEDIKMRVKIDDNIYNVTNGAFLGRGVLSVSDINYSLPSSTLTLKVFNNLSIELIMSYYYSINVYNVISIKASGLIRNNFDNIWTFDSTFTRFYNNYSMRFYYPSSWFNFSIYRDGINITDQINWDLQNRLLIIPNNTILMGSTWQIKANSFQIDFQLNVPQESFEPGQKIQFSLQEPVREGNYTLQLFNPLDFPVLSEVLQFPGSTNLFSFLLSSNPLGGTYLAFVFWNNATDAGVETQQFQVVVSFIIPLSLVAIIGSIGSIASFIVVKKHRTAKEHRRQTIYNKYMDALNLDYFIVSDKKSGLNIFDEIITESRMDSSLISGFLQAIRGFGIELTKSTEESQTIKLEYQDSKILMSEYKNIRIVLIMKENPSPDFLKSVDSLTHELNENFGKYLDDFDGDISVFRDVSKMMRDKLLISLVYPLNLGKTAKIRINSYEKSIIERAKLILKERKSDHFYVSNFFTKKKKFQIKDAEVILHLIQKNIFIPYLFDKVQDSSN